MTSMALLQHLARLRQHPDTLLSCSLVFGRLRAMLARNFLMWDVLASFLKVTSWPHHFRVKWGWAQHIRNLKTKFPFRKWPSACASKIRPCFCCRTLVALKRFELICIVPILLSFWNRGCKRQGRSQVRKGQGTRSFPGRCVDGFLRKCCHQQYFQYFLEYVECFWNFFELIVRKLGRRAWV